MANCQFCKATDQDLTPSPWGTISEPTCPSCELRYESEREREAERAGMEAFERERSDKAE